MEDHALKYADFEGKIGEHHYGAGQVMIWDKGAYETIPPPNHALPTEALFENGLLEFRLYGKKLKGKWRFVKIKRKKRDWLLIKGDDECARRTGDVLRELPDSVVSGKMIDGLRWGTIVYTFRLDPRGPRWVSINNRVLVG